MIYDITITDTAVFTTQVEADSEEEAIAIAEERHGNDLTTFSHVEDRSFEAKEV
jgi:hypothetical protein